MFLLFLSFLSIKLGDIWEILIKQWEMTLWLTGVKLLLLPFLVYLLFKVTLGNMNNVLINVFSAQFFGPLEATLAAMYMIPFFMIIFPLKIYRQWRMNG